MTTEGPREWDADTYDRLPIPMTAWGAVVLEWLELQGDERVLDAGCGTGQVTSLLRDRLPRGWVIALDGSAAMIERARERLGDDRVEYVVADLASPSPLPIEPVVDAVLSTATFHWILDHDALFRGLAAVMRPGGQLAAQCGGVGNIASIEEALAEMGEDFRGRKHFATPSATSDGWCAQGSSRWSVGSAMSRPSCRRVTWSHTWRRSASAITSRGWILRRGGRSCARWRPECRGR